MARKWGTKGNESNSIHVTFTLKKSESPNLTFNGTVIPKNNEVKYLGIHFDNYRTWKNHMSTSANKCKFRLRNKSQQSLENKIHLYKGTIIPISSYGIQLWGCAKKSNMNIIQRFQNKSACLIIGAPWCVTNAALHKNLNINYVQVVITHQAKKYENNRNYHPNHLAINPLFNENNTKCLNRTKPQAL